jgi:RNA polymerase sigma factor (sigma-70 family)
MTNPARPEPNDRDLLANLAWVQRVARQLAGDHDAGSDLAQHAAAHWHERAPRWARSGPGLRGWFARALQSLAVDTARRDRARKRREQALAAMRASATPTHEDPAAIVQRLERQQRVAAAVAALDEPYRTTILLRYLDELDTNEVARRTAVPAATVRKRLERGLGLLRQRLDAEFGGERSGWALALLPPAARAELLAAMAAAPAPWLTVHAGMCLAVAALVLTLAVGAWLWQASQYEPPLVAVGGHGVLVPAAALTASESPELLAVRNEIPVAADRTATPGGSRAAGVGTAAAVIVAGRLFVDGQRTVPPELSIVVLANLGETLTQAKAEVHEQPATWRMAMDPAWTAATLWVTSDHTAPAQIPLPTELLQRGGGFDLHLTAGRRLELTFLDETTGEPLADLPVEIELTVETARGNGRVWHRGHRQLASSGPDGTLAVHGLPLLGSVQVGLRRTPRTRALLLRGGGTVQVDGGTALPLWRQELTASSPSVLTATVHAQRLRGEATAAGVVPHWARAADGGLAAVQVVARERLRFGTDAAGLSDRYLLPLDAEGRFELTSDAPCQHLVQLQRQDGTWLAEPVAVEFQLAGAQAPILFTPRELRRLQIVCRGVPDQGVLEVVAGSARQSKPCRGQALTFDLEAGKDVAMQLRYSVSDGAAQKSGWQREVPAEACVRQPVELDLGLGDCLREVTVEAATAAAARGGEAQGILLVPVRGGAAAADERVRLLLDGLAGEVRVPLRAGLWVAIVPSAAGWIGGVVAVAPTDQRVHLPLRCNELPVAAASPGALLETVDGVSLAALPKPLRRLRVPTGATVLQLPANHTLGN